MGCTLDPPCSEAHISWVACACSMFLPQGREPALLCGTCRHAAGANTCTSPPACRGWSPSPLGWTLCKARGRTCRSWRACARCPATGARAAPAAEPPGAPGPGRPPAPAWHQTGSPHASRAPCPRSARAGRVRPQTSPGRSPHALCAVCLRHAAAGVRRAGCRRDAEAAQHSQDWACRDSLTGPASGYAQMRTLPQGPLAAVQVLRWDSEAAEHGQGRGCARARRPSSPTCISSPAQHEEACAACTACGAPRACSCPCDTVGTCCRLCSCAGSCAC